MLMSYSHCVSTTQPAGTRSTIETGQLRSRRCLWHGEGIALSRHSGAASCQAHRGPRQGGGYWLDCYWVGSLDFIFGGNQGFSIEPTTMCPLLQRVNSNRVGVLVARHFVLLSF